MSAARARVEPPRTVIALHCSGADANQWRGLREALGQSFVLFAPEHFGCERVGPWPGERAFTIDDEAKRTLALLEACEEKVHVVGHSYGGGVALHVALQRPNRIASLTLYEPSAFHLLPQFGEEGRRAHAEISRVAQESTERIVAGDCRGGAAYFIDYWNGNGAFNALSPRVQAALTRWAPKISLDFRALMQVTAAVDAYAALTCPALLLRGEHAPTPTRLIAEMLADVLPHGRLQVVPDCGHMGPLTHAGLVVPSMVSHIAQAAAATAFPKPCWAALIAGQRDEIPAARIVSGASMNRSTLVGKSSGSRSASPVAAAS